MRPVGEWVAEFPDRPVHGYRISQLFSSSVDPGDIMNEYRTTRLPELYDLMRKYRPERCVVDGMPETHATRELARHVGCDAKILEEDEKTGEKRYRYVKAGWPNHYSLALTYALLAADTMSMPLTPEDCEYLRRMIAY